MHLMRCVLEKQPALFKSFQDQSNVPLLEITHAAVDQLGASAGGALGEIVRFQQQCPMAAGGCIDGASEASRASADDDDVPRRFVRECIEHFFAIHALFVYRSR